MARVIINQVDQLKRNKKLLEFIEQLKSEDIRLLKERPNPKSWSVIEVVEHMNIAEKIYEPKIEKALNDLANGETKTYQVRTSRIPSYLIKRFPPKNGRIKMKMKTTKIFKPVLDPQKASEADIERIFTRLKEGIRFIENTLLAYPSKKITEIKFSSAIGPIVKFNIAEACEFVICHNERHVQQVQNTIKILKSKE